MWRVQMHNTITGALVGVTKPSSGSWRRALGEGSGQHVLQLRDAESGLTRALAHAVSQPNATTTVVLWGDTVVYAGLNISSSYSAGSGELTVNHSEGFRELLRNRYTFSVGDVASGNLMIAGVGVRGALRAVLLRATGQDLGYGATWRLPIDVPELTLGTIQMPVYWHEWRLIDDLLVQIEALGYELEFEPYLDEGGLLRWRVRVDRPALTGGTIIDLPVSAPRSLVTDLEVVRDGSRQLSGVFFHGKGSEADMRVGSAGFIAGEAMPVRDAARSAKDIDDVGRLNEMAAAELAVQRNPIEQWGFSIQNEIGEDGAPVLDFGVLRTGSMLRLHVFGDPFLADGYHEKRLIGLSGDMTWKVKPEVQ